MSVQTQSDNKNTPFILNDGLSVNRSVVIAQNAGRTTDLLFGTVLAKIAVSGLYVPFINEAALDGTAHPLAVYIGGDIPFADIVAGNVDGAISVLGGDVVLDENQVVFENAKTKATVIGTGTVAAKTVEDSLMDRGIFLKDTVEISQFA